MAEGDVEFGHVVDLTLGEPSGTELVADAAIGATTLTVDYAGDFEDVGDVSLNGATLAYTSIAYGAAEADPDVITLAAPLAAAAVVDDKVIRVSGGEPLSDWLLHVSLGDGHPVDIPIPFEQRALWSSVDTSTPVPVMVSSDLERLVEVPGRIPTIDGNFVDLTAATITGALIRTSASGNRLELVNSDELRFYSGDPAETAYGVVTAAISDGPRPAVGILSGRFGTGSASQLLVQGGAAGGVHSDITAGAQDITLMALNAVLVTNGIVNLLTISTPLKRATLQSGLKLDTTTGGWEVDSAGNGSVGTGTFRDSVRSAVMGDYAAGAWTAYTPTFTAATTNPTLGSFTRAGRYTQRGKTVTFSIVITATAGTGLGAGAYSFGLPVAARAAEEVVVQARQTAPTHTYVGSGDSTTSFLLTLTATEVTANASNSGMASGTVLRISGTYEAA